MQAPGSSFGRPTVQGLCLQAVEELQSLASLLDVIVTLPDMKPELQSALASLPALVSATLGGGSVGIGGGSGGGGAGVGPSPASTPCNFTDVSSSSSASASASSPLISSLHGASLQSGGGGSVNVAAYVSQVVSLCAVPAPSPGVWPMVRRAAVSSLLMLRSWVAAAVGASEAKRAVAGLTLHRHTLMRLRRARQFWVTGGSGQLVDAVVVPPHLGASQCDGAAAAAGAGVTGAGGGAGMGALGDGDDWAALPISQVVRDGSGKPRPTVVLCNPNAGMYEQSAGQSDWLDMYGRMGYNVVMFNYR